MKSFLVILKEKSAVGLSDKLLTEHIAHLTHLNKKGHLLMCGPFADDSGAMLVMQADSHEVVENLLQSDPFIRENYYSDYSICEFYRANAENNYLMSHEQTLDELNRK